jgi:hypothetical protein
MRQKTILTEYYLWSRVHDRWEQKDAEKSDWQVWWRRNNKKCCTVFDEEEKE